MIGQQLAFTLKHSHSGSSGWDNPATCTISCLVLCRIFNEFKAIHEATLEGRAEAKVTEAASGVAAVLDAAPSSAASGPETRASVASDYGRGMRPSLLMPKTSSVAAGDAQSESLPSSRFANGSPYIPPGSIADSIPIQSALIAHPLQMSALRQRSVYNPYHRDHDIRLSAFELAEDSGDQLLVPRGTGTSSFGPFGRVTKHPATDSSEQINVFAEEGRDRLPELRASLRPSLNTQQVRYLDLDRTGVVSLTYF